MFFILFPYPASLFLAFGVLFQPGCLLEGAFPTSLVSKQPGVPAPIALASPYRSIGSPVLGLPPPPPPTL